MKPKRTKNRGLLLAGFLLALFPSLAFAGNNPNQLVKLLDYIGADYGRAVENGEIKSETEFEELKQFQQLAQEQLDGLLAEASDNEAKELRDSIKAIGSLIHSKADAGAVATFSHTLREKVMARFRVRSSPVKAPSYEVGKQLFSANCAICHGANGSGDGAIASQISPPPTNFLDPEISSGLSPFKAYNVLSLGIEQTAMPSFQSFSEEDRWSLAFYVLSLPHSQAKLEESKVLSAFSLSTLSDSTDQELLSRLKSNQNVKDPHSNLAFLRTRASYVQNEPDAFEFAQHHLDFAEGFYRGGQIADAEQARLAAYLDGIESVEPRLRAIDPKIVDRIEQGFMKLRASIKSGTEKEVSQDFKNLRSELVLAKARLEDDPKNAMSAFWLSFLIIVREGIEAALIVGAILGLLRNPTDRPARVRVHLGWISALLAGGLTWFASQTLIAISGAGREMVEGVASLVAAGVLFYVSYWLLSKVESQHWMKFIHSHVKGYMATGSLAALTGLSFLAVYRESFETVLFYQGLVQSYPDGGFSILIGFLCGAIALLLIVLAMFKLGMKLPLRTFFTVTGILLYVLAFILAGKGIWAMQEGGFLPLTPISIPQISLLGIYPSLEGVLLQSLFILAVIIGVIWMRMRSAKSI